MLGKPAPILVASFVLIAALALVVFTKSDYRFASDDRQSLVLVDRNRETKPDKQHNESPTVSVSDELGSHANTGDLSVRDEFDSAIAGNERIDEFILRHLKAAEAGNPDSAIYLSEAMGFCASDLRSLKLTRQMYGIEDDEKGKVRDAILNNLVGTSEYVRNEVVRHIETAFACERLGWSEGYFDEQFSTWEKIAEEAGQPIALARAASVDPNDFSYEQLESSKKVMRDVLKRSKDFRVLLYAARVSSASTGNNYEFERLAWALAACEYKTCDTLNYMYRAGCEIMTMDGVTLCTEDTTDIDYLFMKYPGQFDSARARAVEIRSAIDSESWALVGLE